MVATNKIKGNDNRNTGKPSGLRNNLIRLVTVPLLITGIVIMIFSYYNGYNTVSKEVENGLRNIASAALYGYAGIYESDIRFVEKENLTYELDEASMAAASDTSYIDYLKDKTGSEVTLFYYDIRIITTIMDDTGRRMNGTVVSKKVVDEVFGKGQPVFYDDIMVGNDNFYVCYIPVMRDDKCIGMVAAGKPTSYVKKEILSSTLPIILIILVMIFLASLLSTGEARRLAEVIAKEKNFLGQIADGNLRANLDADILKRDDELGEMGKFTVHVQRFIRDMIERDTLTKLYTRRIGEPRLRDTRQRMIDEGVQFQLVMGDIDHFKRFNDTYGHDCGDLVLQSVAGIFNRMMLGKGYAVRWGGEEFIICFENFTYDQAYEHLCAIREEIIHHIVEYKDEKLSITMTFGIVPGSDEELDEIIKQADNLLYVGKEGGRDRIVRLEDYESLLKEANMTDPELEKKKKKEAKAAAAKAEAQAQAKTQTEVQTKVQAEVQTEAQTEARSEAQAETKAKESGAKKQENKKPQNSSGKKVTKTKTEPKTGTGSNTAGKKPEPKTGTGSKSAQKAKNETKPKSESKAKTEPKSKTGSKAKTEPKSYESVFETALNTPVIRKNSEKTAEPKTTNAGTNDEEKMTEMLAKMMGVSKDELTAQSVAKEDGKES